MSRSSWRNSAAALLVAILSWGGAEVCPAAPPAQPAVVIVIDPGHGGKVDSGSMAARTLSASNNASSSTGLREKDLTLELSQLVAGRLEALLRERGRTDVAVRLTRTTDTNPDFAERARLCAEAGAGCIVSLHFNATAGSAKALGSLAMIAAESRNPNHANDRRFAQELTQACSAGVQKFLPASRPRPVITDGHLHGGRGSNFFFQLARIPALAATPKCFLEVEFLDHPQTQRDLLDRRPESFRAIAEAIAEALLVQVTKK